MTNSFLESAIKQFEYYKLLGEKTISQLTDADLFLVPGENSNSIAMIVKHMSGNMLSRWTDFLTTDGEKEWRNRDTEFENDIANREALMQKWNEGWQCLLQTLRSLTTDQLEQIVYIRNQGHTVTEAINRQLAHYPYHIGQIVLLGKMMAKNWESLSIAKGSSKEYNADKFAAPKERKHFTDDMTDPK